MAAISNVDESKKRFEAAQTLLAADPRVDAQKLAAIGYCFGGANVLHMARFGDNQLKLIASFHGNLATQQPLQKGTFQGKIFVAQGQSDDFWKEREAGTLRRFLVSPRTLGLFLAGKVLLGEDWSYIHSHVLSEQLAD